jgi:hypothetical protein
LTEENLLDLLVEEGDTLILDVDDAEILHIAVTDDP